MGRQWMLLPQRGILQLAEIICTRIEKLYNQQLPYCPLISRPLCTNFSKNFRTEGRPKKGPTNLGPTKKRAD